MGAVKKELKGIINDLSDNCSWSDVFYKLYVRKKIDEGLEAEKRGDLIAHKDIIKKFLKK